MPDQGGLAVAVGDNTRRVVFYPSDELAALLAEFSGRFGISRSVLVRRAVRQGLAATVADVSGGREAPSSDVPDDLPVSPGSARSRLVGQLTDLVSAVNYQHPDADPDLVRSIVEAVATTFAPDLDTVTDVVDEAFGQALPGPVVHPARQ